MSDKEDKKLPVRLSSTYQKETEETLIHRENVKRTLLFGFSWSNTKKEEGALNNGK